MYCREKLVRLVDEYESQNITWTQFQTEVGSIHVDRIGAPHYRAAGEMPKLEENFYANPFPGCICENQVHQETSKHSKTNNNHHLNKKQSNNRRLLRLQEPQS